MTNPRLGSLKEFPGIGEEEQLVYKPVDPQVDFPAMEERILAFWEDNLIFEKSIKNRGDAGEFVFYDGPPFATGLPHFGHFVPGTIKDIIPRYKTMKGFKVERRFGWDCHGLPVEYEMEKELGISGKTAIEAYGVAKFNEACRSIVLRYTAEWRQLITRSGRWVDFDQDYKTMDLDYMESIWWVVKSLWEKDLMYKGHYILPTCPRCSTPLSNHELNLGGYKDVHDPAITLRFALKEEENSFFLAWTTTPWTLISNVALALGPEVDYVKIKAGENAFILAEERLSAYFPSPENYQLVWRKKGAQLEGLAYKPLFPFFADLEEQGAFRTRLGAHATAADGTGIVHTASGFGEEDYEVMKDTGVPVVCPVDDEGLFTAEVPDYQGRFVKDADKDIIQRLKQEGKLEKRDQILHAYPHCWRCDSPLIYKAVGSWFVNVQKIKTLMLENNQQIRWIPQHLQQGRFGKWLENARDWAVSRNRYWGNPLPLWECDTCGKITCIGSREELQQKAGVLVEDLHKHFIDDLSWPCSCGSGSFHRVAEVLDCWFESGAMPYAQVHYPFENKAWFEEHFPADFISEGLDQTRGWFYTLTILAAALFGTPAFRNVIVNGLVLASDGKKMSKSLRNFTDPGKIINRFGADALRLYLMNSQVVKGEGLKFSDQGVREVLKGILLPFWNAYSFFVTYANIDGVSPSEMPRDVDSPLDRWILSETGRLAAEMEERLEAYDIQKALEPFVQFIDSLNNWYIRRSRRRFWKSENDQDKAQAYGVLRTALFTLAKLSAPFTPFLAEEIYQNLREEGSPLSVHLQDWPAAADFVRDHPLEKKMAVTRRTVSLGRALRNAHELKIRQPLSTLHLVTRDNEEEAVLKEMTGLLKEELNVKEVIFRDNEEDLVTYQARANFSILGRKLGKDMKAAAQRIAQLDSGEIHSLLEGETLMVRFAEKELELTADLVEIRRQEKAGLKVLNDGSLTIALDPEISPELRQEGQARDLVRGIQNLRKEKGLEVTDRIHLRLSGPPELKLAFQAFQDYIAQETLASRLSWGDLSGEDKIPVGDLSCQVVLRRD